MWNERYSQPGFAYGTAPNDFLVSVTDIIPLGKILSLAEGEGRNAVYLASRGYDVVAVDSSGVGMGKAKQFALDCGVTIATVVADLRDFHIAPESWEGIVSIYCHLPSAIRVPLHKSVVNGLKCGGVFVLEAFSLRQIGYGTGGPQSEDMLMSLDALRQELAGLRLIHAVETEREVLEGRHHTGMASIVQIVAVKDDSYPIDSKPSTVLS
ncbi:methyltransferase domain-containing protein [Geobacter hydrogenophilus]|uniref:SAM-dependent methyltransferase n=1 Tax=Geobacter hydrogenophilus TaxID=40983 RepID=A0A9W6G1R9_9BACT|nr:class I SAM-dependent methyltransferase [Geobacter hydrogenophilus]MBT0895437.1 methyltransferase domain-containing protein [Geobacter hydrogenophilus]GLI38793.1 SAM-dependent methyltransferase [Geobacter hydrogenophilus]